MLAAPRSVCAFVLASAPSSSTFAPHWRTRAPPIMSARVHAVIFPRAETDRLFWFVQLLTVLANNVCVGGGVAECVAGGGAGGPERDGRGCVRGGGAGPKVAA
eukprot:695585-Rhodomonas_salina.1